jgi:hypothetical protein
LNRQPLSDLRRNLVIRSHAPMRAWLGLLATAAGGVLAAWLLYEYGRRTAGFDSRMAAGDRATLEARIDAQELQMRELRVQLAADEETRLAQVRERSEVARTIGDLQAQLARAQQDLQFYRGIANPKGTSGPAVSVQQFSVVTRDAAARRYTLRLALARESRQETAVGGQLLINVDGERGDSAASVDLATISDSHGKQLPFSFRYFTNIEQPVTLPEGFKPERVTIEVKLRDKAAQPYRKTFVWNPSN